jgi:hypothetical protein
LHLHNILNAKILDIFAGAVARCRLDEFDAPSRSDDASFSLGLGSHAHQVPLISFVFASGGN